MSEKVYGIDLGTTNSAIAVYEGDEARVLKNQEGDEITPSVVFFSGVTPEGDDEVQVGRQAKNLAATAPENVVQFVKRLMGQSGPGSSFLAPSGKTYTPEMISAFILKRICQDAEEYEGSGAVRSVVITVPAYFDDARRTATKQAGRIAGLNVLRVINEPTAAAIAFGLDCSHNGKVLVYDLGGGTFDVTVMDINGGKFDVVATTGDHQLGGLNFDQKLIALILRKLAEQGVEVNDEDDALMADIREKAELAKIQLSRVELARPLFRIGGQNCKVAISRAEFEAESESLMQRTQLLVEEVMQENNLRWDDIDQLLVVGGSTRMPMVKRMLETISGKDVTYKVDPDTAVAMGAAIFGSTLRAGAQPGAPEGAESFRGIAPDIQVSDVTSQSLGVVTLKSDDPNDLENTIIIPHNSKIPTKRSETVYTVADNQTRIKVDVTEGDDTSVEFVKIIGSSTLTMPPYPKHSPLEIVYAYDPDQTVYIEVIDKTANRSLGTFQIERVSNLTEDQVKNATGVVHRSTVE